MVSKIILAIFPVIFATYTYAVPLISVEGANFIESASGNRFQVIGVAYQPAGSSGYNPGSGVDPLSDGSICLRDAALMQQLGINTVRVYNVDPKINHDLCASIFNQVGIYLMIDVNSPLSGENINRLEPWTSYYGAYLSRIFSVVEAFKNYPNTLLFFAGNEVVNDVETGESTPPYLRAVTRDLKNYISKNSKRKIPVGYSAADVRENLFDTWNYLLCTTTGDDNDPSRGDIFAVNSYSWCGDSSITESGYDTLIAGFANTSAPVFFSEYGCNTPAPRVFSEVPAIYGPVVSTVLSGGVVYEFSQEPANFGLVELKADGSAQVNSDFETLQKQFGKLDQKSIQGTKPEKNKAKAPVCSASLITSPKFNRNFKIPVPPPGAQELIDNGVPNPPVGKIIPVTDTVVKQKVLRSNGDPMTNLKIKLLAQNDANSPPNTGNSSDTGRTVNDAQPSPTDTKTPPKISRPEPNNDVMNPSSVPTYTAASTSAPSKQTDTKSSGSEKTHVSRTLVAALIMLYLSN
ncbi:unnamed protein product [Blumeria hordei]|uniref:1,3-beta-glucanosyltransferase n=2 Tax=Blumeria hordei TaxID=2867405 RepID=A0A383V0K5_BLUHO|nr:beta-1,3-glucanosyltransferase [Blumeria hordei DH14]SZF05388.1 unnamed protein product [Blumeria hordei]